MHTQTQCTEEIQLKITKGKVIQKYGGLTVRDTEIKLAEKARKAREEDRAFKKLLTLEKKMELREGIADRRAERERKKKAKGLLQAIEEGPLGYLSQ